jgi:GTP-binding protein
MNPTRGTGLMSHVFDSYAPVKGEIPERCNGVLVSAENGPAVAYAVEASGPRPDVRVSGRDALKAWSWHPQPR